MAIIYHITTDRQWQDALATGEYRSTSLAEEGFIHCSEDRQVANVLDRYFKDQPGLVKLVIETGKLSSPLYFDWSSSIEDTFPHVYGPINIGAVNEAIPL